MQGLILLLFQMSLKERRKKPSLQEAELDEEVELRDDELSHIVEIYDFPSDFKTEDLIRSFSSFQCVTRSDFRPTAVQ